MTPTNTFTPFGTLMSRALDRLDAVMHEPPNDGHAYKTIPYTEREAICARLEIARSLAPHSRTPEPVPPPGGEASRGTEGE